MVYQTTFKRYELKISVEPAGERTASFGNETIYEAG